MTGPTQASAYRERVLPRAFTLLPLLLIPPISYLTFLPFNELLGLGVGIAVVAVTLVSIWFAAPVIEIDEAGLAVGDIQLPLANIGAVTAVPATEAFRERGPELNPMAFRRFQSSVRTMVKVEVLDAEDPTPYWLVSTRNPELVKTALEQLTKR